jgi:hypothetical protein
MRKRRNAYRLLVGHQNERDHKEDQDVGGFWIGLLDLLTIFLPFLLIKIRLQQLTINDCLRLDPFRLDYWLFSFLVLLYCDWLGSATRMNYAWWMVNESACTNECVLSRLILRLTVSRPVCLGREDGSVFYNCRWSSPAQSFSGPSPFGLVTIFYCLRFQTSLFVASYDSQGHGGGILACSYPRKPLFRRRRVLYWIHV